MPEPDGRGSVRAALPPNARILVVSAGFGEPGDDEADELARQLHDFGWWVDLPRGAGVASSRPPRRFAGVRRVARGPSRTGFDRVATQTASRLGPDAHAVVATHPRMAVALGRVRLRGTFVGPLIACLAEGHEPVAGCDLLLAHTADAASTIHAFATDPSRRRPASAALR